MEASTATPAAASAENAQPVPGQTQLFAPDGYAVTKIEAVLGGITVEDNALAEVVLGQELHLNIRDAKVTGIQFRRDGTKRITLHAESFRPTVQK